MPQPTDTQTADRVGSLLYATGYSAAIRGERDRNPCEGNPLAADPYYFGYINGAAARKLGREVDSLKPTHRKYVCPLCEDAACEERGLFCGRA